MAKSIKLIFLLVGFLLLGWAVSTVDLTVVLNLLIKLGYGFTIILIIYGMVTWLDTIAWQKTFKPEEARQFNLWSLWLIKQVGDAYNAITPLGTLGGEPVKGPAFERKTQTLAQTRHSISGNSTYNVSYRPRLVLYSRNIFHTSV